MATSSIFHSVFIEDEETAARLVRALERSKKSSPKRVAYSHPVEVVTDPKVIRKMFGAREDESVQHTDN